MWREGTGGAGAPGVELGGGLRRRRAAADELVALIAAEPGLDADLVIDPARPTTVKTRFVAGGQQLLRLDSEDARPVEGAAGSSPRGGGWGGHIGCGRRS